MANVLEGNEYKSYIMAILASALFSEDTKVPVTLTDYIYDPTLGKFQNEINAKVSDPKTVTVFVFKSTANETDPNATPNPPTGGSWDMTTDILQLPEGWTTNDELDAPVWLSYGVFGVKNGESTLIQDWSTPVRISGADGIDGKDGNGYTYIYSRTENSDTTPTWIENWTIDQALAQGWTQSPLGITETLLAEWVAILPDATEENPNPKWQGPVLWSKWGVNGKDGDGVEYIYCLSTGGTPSIKHLTEDDQQKREYVPKGETGTGYSWTDSPSGVTEEIKYEWVSIRKLNHETQIWGEFTTPKIWAKYGETGPSGMSVWIAYNDSIEKPSEKPSNDLLELGNGWYFAEDISSNNDPIWWCLKRSQTVEGGTWGPVLKLNGKDGTSVTIKSSLNSEDDLCSIEDSKIGDSYLIGENLYIRVESESEGVKTCGNGAYWKNAGVIKGPKGDSQYLHIRYADRIECDESNVCEYIFTEPDGTQPGRYLGTYVSKYNSADEDENITLSTAYSWYDTKGEPGIVGSPSEFYTISTNTNVIIKKSTGEYDPVNIIPYLKHVKGNVTNLLTAVPEGYELLYWNDKPEEEGQWETYTNLGEGLGILVNSLNEKIKFKLLRDSDSDNNYELVDELEVPIVTDGSDAYTIVYSDQNVAIECDFAGTPVDLEPRNVKIRVMKGSLYVNIKSGDTSVEYITVTIDPEELESVTTVFPGTLLLLDGTELNYSINAIKVQPGTPAQNPIYIQTSQTSILYECGIEPESGDYYLKSPTRAVELTFALYEGLTQQAFTNNPDVEIESLSSSETPFDSILEKYKLDNENKTLTVTIPNLSDDENLKNYGDFKIIVSDTYNDKNVSAEIYVDFYIQDGVITKPLFAFTKTNEDISTLNLVGLNNKDEYMLPKSEELPDLKWSSNTDITGDGLLWKAEGFAEIRKTSTAETTYDVTWYKPYILLDDDSREIIYTDKKDKKSIPSIETYGGPTEEWFKACNAVNWYDDTVDSNGNTFEAIWMATNDKKSGQNWSDNWVFNKLYNENIQYKIVTSLPSQPAPGSTTFTAKAIKTVDGVEDTSFTDYSLTVTVGNDTLNSTNNEYTTTFEVGEVITIKLFVNGSLQEIYTATVTIGEEGPEGAPNYTIEATPDTIYVNVDNDSTYTLEAVSETITIKVLKGGVDDSSEWDIIAKTDSGEQLSGTGTVQLSIEQGTTSANWIHYIDVTANYFPMSLSKRINIVYNPKGDPGDDGNDGKNARYLHIDKPTITVVVDEYEQAVKTATYTSLVTLFDGFNPIAINDNYKYNVQPIGNLTNSSVSWASISSAVPTKGNNTGKLVISVTYTKDIGMIDPLTTLNITITENATGIVTKGTISIVYVQQGTRGKDGAMGETGPLMYPAGTWKANEGITYKVINNTVPYVYYPEGKTLDTDPDYFVLRVNETTKTTGVNDSGSNPLEDTTNWQPVTQYEAIWTKVLMANFANIASAVFWGNYMFSEQGVTKDGNLASLDGTINGVANYATYAESMFDTEGKLNGTITPNIVLDFNTGEAKFNKLSSPFVKIPKETNYYFMDLSSFYNISVNKRSIRHSSSNTLRVSPNYVIIFMPKLDLLFDGTNCKIIVLSDDFYQNFSSKMLWKNSNSDTSYDDDWKNASNKPWAILNHVVVLCADSRITDCNNYQTVNSHTYYNPNPNLGNADNDFYESEETYAKGYFIVNGEKTKFLFLLPGLTVNLISCESEDNIINWYVENASDFARIPVTIQVYKDDGINRTYAHIWQMLSDHPSLYGTTSNQTTRTTFGSKYLRTLVDKVCNVTNATFTSNDAMLFNLYLDTTSIKPDLYAPSLTSRS